MSINAASLGVTNQVTKNPVKCQTQNNKVTFTYDDGSQTSVIYSDGKFTKTGRVKPGNIGAYTCEITKEEAIDWFKEEASKLPGSKKLNIQA